MGKKNYLIDCNNTKGDFVTDKTIECGSSYKEASKKAKDASLEYVSVDLICEEMLVTNLSMGVAVSCEIWKERYENGVKINRTFNYENYK